MISINKTLLLLLLVQYTIAQEVQNDECSAQTVEDYNMSYHVGALFLILCTSSLGIFTPIIMHKISPYSKGSFRDWMLTVGKFFGTGVILATAFVHMLPEALENFGNPCLSAGWQSYGAFAGVFCMISSFGLQLLEIAAVENLEKIRIKKANEQMSLDIEKVQQSTDSLNSSSTAGNPPITCNDPVHEHVHSAGLFEDEDAFKHIGTLILEFGIAMHSIIIGITLSNTGKDEFLTLFIALTFHQFFEGVALGTRINDMNIKGWKRPIIMAIIFVIMTPIGCAIGIGIHSSFNENSQANILSSAILDSLSAGILLYNAYISLMSNEMNQNPDFRKYSFSKKFVCFISMYAGAALMALLGKWA